MRISALYIACLLLPIVCVAQKAVKVVHPLSDPDIIYGKVAQTKEIFYDEPKPGAAIDTAEKRITWYDDDSNMQNMARYRHTKTGWVPGPEFAIRLLKFGSPAITTGKDSLDFNLKYDSLGNEVERKNYNTDGKLYSKLLISYNPDHTYKKSDFYIGENLIYSTTYTYEQGRLTKEHVTFPNRTTYDITYRYDGTDTFGNWIKRVRIYAAGTKNARVQVTERRVIYYE